MTCEEEISYRNELLRKVHNQEKITEQERQWLLSHRIINRPLGYPYLNTDIIHLQPNVIYKVIVKVENKKYPGRIIPMITVPCFKGAITANEVKDFHGNLLSRKNVKMLGVLVDENHDVAELTYYSELGLLEVSYECEYYDNEQKLIIRKDSRNDDYSFAMLADKKASNKTFYHCKLPTDNSFESFVFSVEWKEADGV